MSINVHILWWSTLVLDWLSDSLTLYSLDQADGKNLALDNIQDAFTMGGYGYYWLYVDNMLIMGNR